MRAARLVVVCVVAACGGKSPPPKSAEAPKALTLQGAAPPEAPPPAPVQPVPPPPPPAPTPTQATNPALAADLALLPADSEAVIGVDIGRMRQSEIWTMFAHTVAAKVPQLAQFQTMCGFDPFATLTTVAVGIKHLGGPDPEAVVVVHGIPTDQLGACVPKLKKIAAKTGMKIKVDKDTFTFSAKTGNPMTVGFLDAQTVLAVSSPSASEASWNSAKTGGSALPTSPAFMAMLHQLSATDPLIALFNGNSAAFSKTAAVGVKMKALFGTLDLTSSLTLDFRMRLGTPDEAKQFTTMAQGQISNPQVKQMFDRLDVTADGADVRFQIAMSADKLRALVAMVGGMIGTMGSP